MKLVIIESPYAGDIARNTQYALECLKNSLELGEAPFASHLLYPAVLDDTIKEERHKGIVCGYQWMAKADIVAVYTDHGVTAGMKSAIIRAKQLDLTIEYRNLYGND